MPGLARHFSSNRLLERCAASWFCPRRSARDRRKLVCPDPLPRRHWQIPGLHGLWRRHRRVRVVFSSGTRRISQHV